MSGTIPQLASQWANPSDVTTVLMIIGGDVVQKALAQTAGCWYTPVCFSFGWVAYTFMALVGVLGDGRLLPIPDYPVKVFNLRTGYVRDNKNWVIGRLLRDHESNVSRLEPATSAGIRITVLEATENNNRQKQISLSYSRIHIWGLVTTITQLSIAAIPLVLNGRWGILFTTGSGTLLALIMGGLPQWRAEKLPNRQRSEKIFALTTGNGSKDIMIVIGAGKGLDLEDLSSQETPRGQRPWEKFEENASRSRARNGWTRPEMVGNFMTAPTMSMKICGIFTKPVGGLPGGFVLTMVVCVIQSMLWLLLLITVAALSTDTWYLILVGGIGMFQNGYLAAMERTPDHRNLPLEVKEVITQRKVMDGLMDLEATYGKALLLRGGLSESPIMPLVKEFFPGRLRPDEDEWWRGDRSAYDRKRSDQKEFRGFPRAAQHFEDKPKEAWATYNEGGNSQLKDIPGREFLSPPKSPKQVYHRCDDIAEGASTDGSHIDIDRTRIVQSRRSNSTTSFSMLQLERPQ